MADPIEITLSDTGILSLRLNKTTNRNALDEEILVALHAALENSRNDPDIRVILLLGSPWVFSVGADLTMMHSKNKNTADNCDTGTLLGKVFYSLWSQTIPTVAVVEGPAMGGGAGLAAACDIVIASTKASFGFPEVRIGLIPAVISPYVINAIGKRRTNQLFLTGEKFSAEHAHNIGLVHILTSPDKIQNEVDKLTLHLLSGGPQAQNKVKQLVNRVANETISLEQSNRLSKEIEAIRGKEEAQHGIDAFLNKKKPKWFVKK